MKLIIRRSLTYCLTLVLASCGGGSGTASIIDGSGSPVPNIAVSGPIGGFGSVIVDGVHYITDKADIVIDGQPASEQDLNLGDFISIQATYNAKTGIYNAQLISAETSVRGVVQSIDTETKEVVLLGQRVLIEGDTVFDQQFNRNDIGAITVGDTIKVSGGSDNSGRIYATRIEHLPMKQESLSGLVSKIDLGAMKFLINNVWVSYAQADSSSVINTNDWVTVTGSFEPKTNSFVAKEVRISANNTSQPVAGLRVRTEGLVQAVVPGGFTLPAHKVTYSTTTEFQGGNSSNIAKGAKVVVEGLIGVTGELVATRIGLAPMRAGDIFGAVEKIVLGKPNRANRIETGTLTVNGINIRVDERSIIVGIGGVDYNRSRLEYFRVGDNVFISVNTLADGTYSARLIELGIRKGLQDDFDSSNHNIGPNFGDRPMPPNMPPPIKKVH